MFHWLEKNPFFFAVGVFIVIAYAGLIEILPNFAEASRPVKGLKPYSVLELAGKEVYKKDNCIACHSQLIRPFKAETDRYGQYSLSGEYAYDRPFLWGSKRTGPDLHRVGNYRTSDWHANHMWDPKSVVPESIMPAYKHQFSNEADIETAYAEAVTVKNVFNTPYGKEIAAGEEAYQKHLKEVVLPEALKIAKEMKLDKADIVKMVQEGKIPEIVALIAYLNRLK
jgi:cytochrome c oxidase cbb3-type subunit 2